MRSFPGAAKYQCDAFETRIMLQRAICTMGEDAAKMFYVPQRFTRIEALPPTALFLLQDEASVIMHDAEYRHRRKKMCMS